jgi:hypothetical protein
VTVTRPNGNAEESWQRPGDTEDTPAGPPAPSSPPAPNPPALNPPPAPGPPPASGPAHGTGPLGPAYTGPPTAVPPPPGWRPPVEYEPAPPRQLPEQDHTELDTAEQSARTITLGVGLAVGAIVLIVVCVLCSRVLF